MIAMKFKLRVVFFGFLSLAVFCMLLFVAVFRESDVTIAKREGHSFPIADWFRVDSKKEFVCSPMPLVKSSADIRTVNIWDNLTVIPQPEEYKVQFPDKNDPKYTKITAEERLTVLIVPHSHNDPGWQKTLSGYYVQNTKFILNNIVDKMTKYTDMKMIWAETVFLALWFEEAPVSKREAMKKLINSGRLDIVNGGWVMPDEASTHYYAIIDQLIEGHQWLLKTFGVKPRINWSIDPFGHSGTVPYLWRLANFDWMVVQRVHQAIKDYLGHYQKLQFLWRQSWDRNGQADMPCHMMPYLSYDTSRTCGPDDLVCRQFKFYSRHAPDFGAPGTPKYEQQMGIFTNLLYEQFRLKAKNFRHNAIFVPLGGDFTWQFQGEWEYNYINFTNIMNFMNAKPEWNIDVKFGTLTEYFDLIGRNPPSKPYPSISGDFFVYSEYQDQYWSGYFTSRPFDKFVGREVQSALKAADVLHILTVLHAKSTGYPASDSYTFLETARRNLGLYQHHDAITGTAKPHVVQDYQQKLAQAYFDLQNVFRLCAYHLLKNTSDTSDNINFKIKPMAEAYDVYNRGFQYYLDSGKDLVVFNPTATRRTEIVSVTLNDYDVMVLDRRQNDSPVAFQVSPVWHAGVQPSATHFDVSFLVHIPPWSLASYALAKSMSREKNLAKISVSPTQHLKSEDKLVFMTKRLLPKKIELENACLRVIISSITGMITSILDKRASVLSVVNMEMISYRPGPRTGAYLFFPDPNTPRKLSSEPISVTSIQGALFSSVRAVHRLFETSIKLHNSSQDQPDCWSVYIDNIATLKFAKSEELVMRFNTHIENDNVVYTDGNGLEMVKHRTFRKLPTQAAFYPMTERASIQDTRKRLTLLSAQPHGAASLSPGQLEILLDRTFSSDDGKGLGEGIKSNAPAPSRFLLLLEHGIEEAAVDADYYNPTLESLYLSDVLQNPLRTLISVQQPRINPEFVPNTKDLPCDANVISFRPLSASTKGELSTALIIQRRAYQCGPLSNSLHCHSSWDFSFQGLFNHITPYQVKEMSLSYTDVRKHMSVDDSLYLAPMEIKSYSAQWLLGREA